MKVKVNNEACIGCGACTCTCDTVFGFNDEGVITVKVAEVPKEVKEAVDMAIEGCPVEAISYVEEKSEGSKDNNTNAQ